MAKPSKKHNNMGVCKDFFKKCEILFSSIKTRDLEIKDFEIVSTPELVSLNLFFCWLY